MRAPGYGLAMSDVMVDLETISTRQGGRFMSIGAVAFDPRGVRVPRDQVNTFYQNVDIVSAQRAGLHVDGAAPNPKRD